MSDPHDDGATIRMGDDNTRPDYAVLEVVRGGQVVHSYWVPRRTLFPELDGLPEWRCPNCGAITRARMADQ